MSEATAAITAQAANSLARMLRHYAATNRLETYRPYPKQLCFHMAGRFAITRLFRAGNQTGKTLPSTAETAMHLTGLYPPWWPGRVWRRPITAWAAGVTAAQTRRILQSKLLGDADQIGTGWIPRRHVLRTVRSNIVKDLFDRIYVRHHTDGAEDGESVLDMMHYEQQDDAWAGESVDLVHFDEEPPQGKWVEGFQRTTARTGSVMVTFTSKAGATEVVDQLVDESHDNGRRVPDETGGKLPDVADICMRIDESLHYSDADIRRKVRQTPAHLRPSLIDGEIAAGEGRVFPLSREQVECEPFEVPGHWPQIGGIDPGWDHPFGAARLAHDIEADVVYVTHDYARSRTVIPVHAATLRGWGPRLRWAWPKDAHQHERGTGKKLSDQLAEAGLMMLPMHAQLERGDQGENLVALETGIGMMLERMESARLKIFRTCELFWREFARYHRDKGVVVGRVDDVLDAVRYALMMLRFARPLMEMDAGGWQGAEGRSWRTIT